MAGAINLRIQQILQQTEQSKLATEAYKYFKSITPIRSGNARRNTHLFQDTIEADYPYAQRLDNGYSQQAPNGMTRPTDRFIQNYIKKVSKG